MAKTASDFLRTAIDRLKDGRGWNRGYWRQRQHDAESGETFTAYCLLGALQIGKDMHPRWEGQAKALDEVIEVFHEQYPDHDCSGPYTLMSWNDTAGRKPEEVIRLLEKAYVRSLEPTFDDDSDS